MFRTPDRVKIMPPPTFRTSDWVKILAKHGEYREYFEKVGVVQSADENEEFAAHSKAVIQSADENEEFGAHFPLVVQSADENEDFAAHSKAVVQSDADVCSAKKISCPAKGIIGAVQDKFNQLRIVMRSTRIIRVLQLQKWT